MTDPNEHVTSYTCAIKGNDLGDDEIESVLLKRFFRECTHRGYQGRGQEVGPFQSKNKDNEMLSEFVSRFHMKWMDLPPVVDDWAIQAFTQGLNIQSSLASRQVSVSAIQGDRKSSGSVWNSIRNEKRSDRGQSNRGLMSKNSFDRPVGPKKAPRLSEYNFNVDVAAIVAVIGRIKDTKWTRPLQYEPSQRDPNLMCKYHGTHVHRIEECQQLREDVARLFNNGHLREFLSDQAKNQFRNRASNKQIEQEEPQHVINMIIGGVDIP
ncbi:uncharacterized protein [Nicotiana tomentosiformis]|uniref:uncharacterized protein n=1 Tax=Nicotiana tomentosiformis TaxID=4098 RepID=UPI00388C9C44